MISVVIATKNRPEALRDISLPSLLLQDYSDFEVILWDASTDDLSCLVAKSFAERFKSRGIDLRYFKAPRVGSASQRNDSVRVVKGSIIFFIDDDSDVSPDGIGGLKECMDRHPESMGFGLTVYQVSRDGSFQKRDDSLKGRALRALGYRKRRKVSLSGSGRSMSAPAGPAEWLSGCSMAFRKKVFDSMKFNEKLETFGSYAIFEDIEFSHRVFRRYGKPLYIAEGGYIVHRSAVGDRLWGVDRAAATFYNRYLTMKVASENHPILGHLFYLWAVGRRAIKMSREFGLEKTFKGLLLAISAIRKERANNRRRNL
ncbi:glycosyl transferase family 2 [Dethiosulfovibrio peptidovorans DSM 11002]|uniref:Glycosyl transferase family 2 n=1 Tax=Dethiosulfovibrio peptidovorans DSM 11002 TaxID=469381 RepID=D2Z342_9BACT|nr:glycosyltransferase [Dethiosulfovibrio peptidovorans]EFC90260.1 glycosyl transferase family 2 [Dethiosulfovibrio peptidovorans DSM 11002]